MAPPSFPPPFGLFLLLLCAISRVPAISVVSAICRVRISALAAVVILSFLFFSSLCGGCGGSFLWCWFCPSGLCLALFCPSVGPFSASLLGLFCSAGYFMWWCFFSVVILSFLFFSSLCGGCGGSFLWCWFCPSAGPFFAPLLGLFCGADYFMWWCFFSVVILSFLFFSSLCGGCGGSFLWCWFCPSAGPFSALFCFSARPLLWC